jgi:hypothetical protein
VDAAVRVLDEDEVELRVDESVRVAVAASERARETVCLQRGCYFHS